MASLLIFNKPFQVLSQFTDSERKRLTLGKFIQRKNHYPAGRLDYDSEGLLLLTENGKVQHWLTDPKHKQWKRYWVQVEGTPSDQSLAQFRAGLELNDGSTRPAKIKIIAEPKLWPRNPPIRVRQNDITSWLEISIQEGRNRQVRRMTATIGHPTLRLIRAAIGSWTLGDLQPGEFRSETINLPRA